MYSELDFETHESIYLYIVTFNSNRIKDKIIKIGITSALETRMNSLKDEYSIEGEYTLLLAAKSNNTKVEKQLIQLWKIHFPNSIIDLRINNVLKTECFKYDSFFIIEVNKIKHHYLSHCKSPIVFENIVYRPQKVNIFSKMTFDEFTRISSNPLEIDRLSLDTNISKENIRSMIKKQQKINAEYEKYGSIIVEMYDNYIKLVESHLKSNADIGVMSTREAKLIGKCNSILNENQRLEIYDKLLELYNLSKFHSFVNIKIFRKGVYLKKIADHNTCDISNPELISPTIRNSFIPYLHTTRVVHRLELVDIHDIDTEIEFLNNT